MKNTVGRRDRQRRPAANFSDAAGHTRRHRLPSGPAAALALLLALAMIGGGSARGDTASLVILRPAAIVLLGYGLYGLQWAQVKAFRRLFTIAVAGVAIVSIQLLPLPPALWTHLPGRALIAAIDQTTDVGLQWRPLSLAPAGTWNSLYALAIPLAVLLLAVRVPLAEHRRLLPWLIGLGLLSSVVALLQIIDRSHSLFPAAQTSPGAGLFANRNHQAVMLATLFPILGVATSAYAAVRPARHHRTVALAISAFLIPLLLVTGSRAGLLAAVPAVAAGVWLHLGGPHREISDRATSGHAKRHWAGRAWLAGGLGALAVAAIVAVTVALGRAEAFERLLYDPRQADAFRFDRWPSVVAMVAKYFPVGTGFGTFVPVYKVDEPDALLGSTYFNHAHNDYLEVALAGGLPAVLLLLYAAGLVTARALQLTGKARGETRLFARLGLVMVVLLALASVVDYPIRTPALSALFALAAVWAAMPLSRAGQPG